MPSSYFDFLKDETKYREWSKHGNSLFKKHIAPGSKWDVGHLAACHIIVAGKGNECLPLLDNIYRRAGKEFAAGDEKKEMTAFTHILAQEHRNMREHALIREPRVGVSLARFWVALRDVKTSNADGEEPEVSRRVSTRVKTQTTNLGFMDPEEMSLSQSQESKVSFPSSAPISVSGVYTEEQAPAPDLPVEDYTVQLAFAVLNHILLYTQDPLLDTPVEIRQRERWILNINSKSITAIDDGGLSLVNDAGTRTKKSVVLIEAKRRLDVCKDSNQPVVSNELLGQMTCEALGARSSGRDEHVGDNVFIINITQHYRCFFHFAITVPQVEDI
ncbi:hypothetical protein FOXG_15307 [Fusarium oxysporum f. sp. lycopersici 4287]|uniref:Uncharacterized protein n=3 Tax=Fusarium oxysporum TaxID=5507 RepID=A0A0J9W2W9_FUSO4|nr:hypothetical protein FOXG_15307 [Fusarium oxysporum f. sp. lycopersici 4287]KAJ9424516.1 hypothetical protein QL093DRAFT_2007375 [Fusarium oxysporum]KNB17201.1 hypothetical protein FOXG_15307 [Fusarium oxysporum f. sp. lycopersici 4287]